MANNVSFTLPLKANNLDVHKGKRIEFRKTLRQCLDANSKVYL